MKNIYLKLTVPITIVLQARGLKARLRNSVTIFGISRTGTF